MFKDKRARNDIQDILKSIDSVSKKIYDNIIECEDCGHLIYKKSSKVGTSEIRKKKEYLAMSRGDYYETEYIHHPYYCKRCYEEKFQDKKEPSKLDK